MPDEPRGPHPRTQPRRPHLRHGRGRRAGRRRAARERPRLGAAGARALSRRRCSRRCSRRSGSGGAARSAPAWRSSATTTRARARWPTRRRWYAPPSEVGFVPSRGVAYGSGLEPAPHLVGERARGLGLLRAGGLVAISAAALVERLPPPDRRATALHVERGGELVRDEAVAALVAAGLHARRARRRPRRAGRARRHPRRLPDDRRRAGAHRALRRRGRAHLALLGVHAALAGRAPAQRPAAGARGAALARRRRGVDAAPTTCRSRATSSTWHPS